jgi:glutamine synthetase
VTGQSYNRDVRYVAQKAENYLTGTGTGDTAYFGPELEHFVFNECVMTRARITDLRNRRRGGELGRGQQEWPKPRPQAPPQGRIFSCAPADALQDTRTNMVSILEQLGILVEAHHH